MDIFFDASLIVFITVTSLIFVRSHKSKRENIAIKQKINLPEDHIKKFKYVSTFSNSKAVRDDEDATADVVLPEPIYYSYLLRDVDSAKIQMLDDLRERGYTRIRVRDHWSWRQSLFFGPRDEGSLLCVLPMDAISKILHFLIQLDDIIIENEIRESYNNYLEQSKLYFLLSDEEKAQNQDPDANNLGYVKIESIREYIKLRPFDSDFYWPKAHLDFRPSFQRFFKSYSKIAFKAFQILAESKRPLNEITITKVDPTRLISLEAYNAISDFLESKSSISAIHYYPTELSELCEEHTDTGILTLITKTEEPGLEIYDRLENKYVKAEQLLEKNDIVIFMGEKVPLFTCSNAYPATYHRVRIPPNSNTHRYSYAFLLDVAK